LRPFASKLSQGFASNWHPAARISHITTTVFTGNSPPVTD